MEPLTEAWLYEEMGRQSPDAFVFADREGTIRLWNRGAERLFGYAAGEACGESLDLIIPENLRGRHWEGYHRVMDTGETGYGTRLLSAPALRKDGTRISVEFSMAIIRDPAGAVVGSGAVMRDVTERWQREKALKERLAVLERGSGKPGC
ncbi:MAG TPA: PAS domain S-box protein [Desulfuromonadaceae bacterium]